MWWLIREGFLIEFGELLAVELQVSLEFERTGQRLLASLISFKWVRLLELLLLLLLLFLLLGLNRW